MSEKKKIILLGIFLFTLILATSPSINVKNRDTKSKQINENSVAISKTSEWKSGFNYSIVDNFPYFWIEINETGTEFKGFTGGNDDGANFTSFIKNGWNFTFYGTDYGYINVSTNGWMTFSNPNDGWVYGFTGATPETYNWDPIPQDCTIGNNENHNDTVCLLATDLDAIGDGQIFYQFFNTTPNKYLVIEYFNYAEHDTNDNQTMEAIFYENGDIKFQYKCITDPWIDGANYWNFPDAKVGLDHGDLINYSNYTNNWNKTFDSSAIQELAIYFRLSKSSPIFFSLGDDDDDDDEGLDIGIVVLIIVLASIGAGAAIIAVLIKKGIIDLSKLKRK